jgi:catechol 2,3-dioxygenase-like lactoylglutathione lyase family enzyme
MEPLTLDHVALWVADRDRIADLVCAHLGMHVIDRSDRFTLVGADARRGKLTLFAAEGPRQRGVLGHVALRVNDLRAAVAGLPEGIETESPRPGELYLDAGEGLRLGLVEAPTESEYDLDHVALLVADPVEAASEFERLGLATAPAGPSGFPRLEVGGAFVELRPNGAAETDRPLLNHLGFLVESAEQHIAEAEELGIEIVDVVDAANTFAVFVAGPDHVKVEYVEHKPSFSLT